MEYLPIKGFEELMSFRATREEEENGKDKGPLKVVPLNKNFNQGVKVSLDGRRVSSSDCPKTLVCHDLKGGYGDDRFVDGTTNHENYVFRHWLQTDIFCYFSHHFVTIPPLGWINAAHKHGVPVLGTIITEWDDGVKLCNQILTDATTIDNTVEQLCEVVKKYGFEGYLVNVENELKVEQVPKMIEFLSKLTKGMKELSPHGLVIWYDSVTIEGKLKWQDELNDKNEVFFHACDGIYLNYGWNEEKLKASREKAGNRKFDVFVGVDVFGRGCFGGGGVNTCLAVEKIHKYQMSYAIFAPGWSYECNAFESFLSFDDALWMPCSQYFYFRCLKDEFRPTKAVELSPSSDNDNVEKVKIFFATDFSLGLGLKCHKFGNEPSCQPWFDLNKQSYQPVLSLCSGLACYDKSRSDKVLYDMNLAFAGGSSVRLRNIKRSPEFESPLKHCPIWFPLDITFPSDRISIAVLAAWKSVSVDHQLQIYLELGERNTSSSSHTKKILLGSVDHLATSIAGKYYITLKLSNFLQQQQQNHGGKDVEFFFHKNNYDEKEVGGWRLSCFLFDVGENQSQKFSRITALKVGAEGDVSLGFLSLAQIVHYHNNTK